MDIATQSDKKAIVFEFKYARTEKGLEKEAKTALDQIYENRYTRFSMFDIEQEIESYGIAFYKKKCKVMKK